MAYGPESSKLMDGETHGTGMPDSKGIEVEVAMAEGPLAGGGEEDGGG
jgi:formylmethanofuran dehydrogenase subunit D